MQRVMRHPLEYFRNHKIRELYLQVKEFNEPAAFEEIPFDNEKYEMERWDKYLDRQYENGIPEDDNYDPLNWYRQAHDKTLLEMKESLTKAVGDKKEHALPIAIQIFNRIQEKVVKTTKINHTHDDNENESKNHIRSINKSLEKMDILLTDPSSPLLSNMRAFSKYAT